MADADRKRWDARWASREGAPGEPDPFVLRALEHVGPGAGRRAVDLACGAGRHALELARRGFSVEAWDVSDVALEKVAELARERGLAVGTRRVDLADGGALGDGGLDLVVVVNFLDRGLLAACPGLLAPGGHLVFATFTVDWPGDHPRAERRLACGELAKGLEGLETVLVEEAEGRAGILARRA